MPKFRKREGAYLIYLGVGLIRSAKNAAPPIRSVSGLKLFGTFNAALLLTLGDLKAILFYASLFPVFISDRSVPSHDESHVVPKILQCRR